MEEPKLLKFYYNQEAFEALAKEFRRASWGAAMSAAIIGYQQNSGLGLILGGVAWSTLQVLAFILQSVRNEKGDTP